MLASLLACPAVGTWPTPSDDDDSAADDDDSAVDDDDAADDDDSAADDDDDSAPVQPGPLRYLVLAPDSLAASATAFAEHRTGPAFSADVLLLSDVGAADAQELQDAVLARLTDIAAELPDERPPFLLILGDAAGPADDPDSGDFVPSLPCTSSLGPCYTDNRYGDLDGDRIPDVAVGRVPARTDDQALAYLDKVRAYEAGYQVGLHNRRLVLYAGASGFGEAFDAVAESLAIDSLAGINHSFDVLGAWDNPASGYYYLPFDDKVVDLFEEGALAAMYIGHGSAAYNDGLSADQLDGMVCENRQPFVFFWACSNGEFGGDSASISEAVLWAPDGPVGAFAGVGTTHPYANAVLPYEAQRALFDHRPATFGEVALRTKHQLIHNDDDIREMARGFAVLSGVAEEELPGIEAEHLDQYNYLGDPALPTAYPRSDVVFDAVGGSAASGHLEVAGETPGVTAGTAWVSVEIEPNEYLDELDPDAVDEAAVAARWAVANDKVVAGMEVPVTDGRFEATFDFDPDQPGELLYVKVYADDGATDSFGYVVAP